MGAGAALLAALLVGCAGHSDGIADERTVSDRVEPTAAEQELEPFTTDGCSKFPEGTREHRDLWLECCTAHDLAYWRGGTYEEREAADEALERCVVEVGEPEIAALMLAGVRAGGSPFWPTTYRWGYGWPYWDGLLPRGYRALTEAERRQADTLEASIGTPAGP